MRSEFRRELNKCSLVNGELKVPGISGQDIKEFGDELRDLVLKEALPHYRVVGVKITTGSANLLTDYITKAKGVSKSYAELLGVFRNLIFAEGGGEAVESMQIGDAASEDIGYFMSMNSEVRSDNGAIFKAGMGVSAKVPALVNNIDVIKFDRDGACIYLAVRKGTGNIEFAEVGSMLHKTEYVPVGQTYDLNNIFTIKMWEPGDKAVYIRYKMSVNEKVLEKILRDYAIS